MAVKKPTKKAKKKPLVKKPSKKIGRPLKWTPELIAEYKTKILNEISTNGLSRVKVCKLEGFPNARLVDDWLLADENFQRNYARACEDRADKIAEEILDICDATSNDIIKDAFGNEVVNHNVIQRDKLRVDARKWLLSKMAPKKYGEKLDITTDNKPINQTIEVEIVKPKKS